MKLDTSMVQSLTMKKWIKPSLFRSPKFKLKFIPLKWIACPVDFRSAEIRILPFSDPSGTRKENSYEL